MFTGEVGGVLMKKYQRESYLKEELNMGSILQNVLTVILIIGVMIHFVMR